jgi:hypothetical protein
VEVVHAKKMWDHIVVSENEIVGLKNALVSQASTHRARESALEHALVSQASTHRARESALEQELAQVPAELAAARSELDGIRASVGFRLVRFFGSRIDKAFPDGTSRGELRKAFAKRVRKMIE